MARLAVLSLVAAVGLGRAAAEQLLETTGSGAVTTLCQQRLLSGGLSNATYCNDLVKVSGVVLGAAALSPLLRRPKDFGGSLGLAPH